MYFIEEYIYKMLIYIYHTVCNLLSFHVKLSLLGSDRSFDEIFFLHSLTQSFQWEELRPGSTTYFNQSLTC